MVTPNVTQGAEVFTSDGDRLGHVAEVHGAIFRVDVSMMPDCWLSEACVTSASADAVRLECTKDEVNHHAMEAPVT